MTEYTSEELLRKALEVLAEEYEGDIDSFFLVVTKEGKDKSLATGTQIIVGEFNLKTLVSFIVQAIQQLCSSLNMNPFVFIARHITSYFIEEEKQIMRTLMGMQTSLMGIESGIEIVEDEEEPDSEEFSKTFIFNDSMVDIEN
ncbi:MAG: hypothetical protein MJA29_10830 [Candidatus Omnitrophica bacterium]|nr:hypothetical protein [Candidatus Omnitrophota bacterium]